MGNRLEGKVAVVTGGGQGLGEAYAKALVAEGARVVIVDLNLTSLMRVAHEINSMRSRSDTIAHALLGDVTDVTVGEKAVMGAVSEFGRCDILVNNAGIIRDGFFAKMTSMDWDSVIATHLGGAYGMTQPFFAHRKIAQDGSIGVVINITSPSGAHGNAGQANYSAAKSGLIAFTRTLAQEGERIGVKTFGLAPVAYTPMTASLFDNMFDSPEEAQQAFPAAAPATVLTAMVSDDFPMPSGTILLAAGNQIKELRMMATPPVLSDGAWGIDEVIAKVQKLGDPDRDTSFPV